MTLTNFPNGVSSFGVPVIGGIGGIPLTGTWYFCDAVRGSDGNEGTSPDQAFNTLTQAYTKCVSGRNDVVVIIGDGSTTATQRLSETLTWAKDATHLIGETAPSMVAQRARISTATGATANVNPLVNVTASGCAFLNFSLFQGVGEAATEEQLWQEAGQRNYYGNVAFGGMGGVAGAADADSYSLQLYGGSENLFENCFFGVDTRDRDAANANVRIRKNASSVASTRNIFRDCVFAMRATDTDPLFIDGNEAGGMDRFTLFKRCSFINSGTSSLLAVASFNAAMGGTILFDNCTAMGVDDWGSSATALIKIASGPLQTATGGLAVSEDG